MIGKFDGPIFIVGMPRSGTQLLRDLLNQNPKIGIPVSESIFIPYMVNRFGNPPRFGDDNEFNKFYRELTLSSFFGNMKRKGCVLKKADLERVPDRKSWRSIFKFIFRFYAPEGRNEDFIWGDKTPGYLNHMHLLKALCPEAKFIHIIRDPRDHCLSVKKTWGKSIFRAAHDWRVTLEKTRVNSHQLGNDYMEVMYESLLTSPREVSSDICQFLQCESIPFLAQPAKSSENSGVKKGQVEICQSNQKKYLTQLSAFEIRRIEEIVYPVAKSMNYTFENDVIFKPLNTFKLKILKLYDGWASVKHYKNTMGLRRGLNYIYHFRRQKYWKTRNFYFN